MEKIVEKYLDIDYPSELGDEDDQYVGSIDDIYKKAFLRGKSVGFDQGYICATANIIRTHGEETIAKDVLKANYSIEDADENDLEVLKPLLTALDELKKSE